MIYNFLVCYKFRYKSQFICQLNKEKLFLQRKVTNCLPFCLQYMQYVPMFHRETFNVSQLYALLYLLFGATFVSFMLIPMALKQIRPTTVSMYNYVQPIIASAIAVAVGQDTFSMQKLLSAALVFVGVYLVTQSKKRKDIENLDIA